MCCRVLLAAIAVTCTFTRIHALGPQRLDLRKDLLCVLILNEVQKEDLDENTLQKLRRHNVNINDLNNESVRNECKTIVLSKIKPLNTTEESHGTDNEITRQNETQAFFTNNSNNENKTEGSSFSEFEANRNGSKVTESNKENNNTQKYNCNEVIKYHNGQPALNSMIEFWKNCVNVKKTIGYYDYISSSKIKHMNRPGTNKTSKYTFSKSDKYYKNVANNYTQDWKQRNRIVNNSYEYTPPAKYYSKNNTGNVLAHQIVNNQNPIKEYRNNKGMSEEPSMQKLYTALDNNYKNQTSKSGNIKELSEIHGDGFLNPGYRDTFKNESVNNDAISKTTPYISNNNDLNSEKIPNNDSFIRKLVKVDELPEFISNIALPANKLFFPKNEPNKFLLARESSNMDELMKIHNGNLFYPINKPYSDLYPQKPIQRDHSYVTVPKISNSNYWDPDDIPNNDPRTGILLNNEELPTFIQTTAEQNFHYSGNEPYTFRREPIQVTYLPKIIPNAPYKYLFHPESEPRRFKIQNESKNKKDDNSQNLTNKSIHDFSDSKNIFRTKSYSIESDLGKITKFFPNASTNRDNLYYLEGATKEFNFSSEAKRQDNLYNITYNIPNGNSSYRDNILSTNVHIHNKTVNNINLTDTKPIKELNIYNENEQNKFSQSKESVNIDKSVKVYNTQEGNVFYQKKEPDEMLFTKERDKIKDPSKTSPNIVNSGLLFNGFAPNRDLDTEIIKLKRKLYDGSKLEGNESESIKEDESGVIYSTRDATNPNMLIVSKVPVNNGLTNAIPNNIVIDIAESIKAFVLKDLKKEFTVASTTVSTRVTTTPATTTTTTQKLTSTTGITQNINKSNESAVQYAVLKEVLKILEQMNILKNNTLNVSEEKSQAKNTNTNLIEGNHKTSILAKTSTTNMITRNTVDKSIIIPGEYNNSEVKQQIIPSPITIQTNLLDIPPLNFYMDRYLDPISQNIVLNTRPVLSNKQSDTKVTQENDTPRQLKKLQGIYPNMPHHRPSQNTAVNVNTNEKLRAAVSTYTNHNNNNVNIDQTYIKPSPKNIAPAYYTYSRPVNTGDIMSAHELSLDVDRQKCCDRQYVSQMMHDCCKERFVSRQQVSLNSAGRRPEPRIKSLIRTHQKVNIILENILASRNKFGTKFRSVENI